MRIIAGIHKGKRLQVVNSNLLRPTTSMLRESLFNICQMHIEGALFLDLFAGIGSIGFEAVSRGAEKVYFVEKEKKHAECIAKNISALHEENKCQLITGDVFKTLPWLEKKKLSFDIIFADPPYGDQELSLSNEVLKIIDQSSLLKKGGLLFLEDHKYASKFNEPLQTLVAKEPRQVGKVFLREFVKL